MKIMLPLVIAAAVGTASGEPVSLENPFVRVSVDPAKGGAVTQLIHKQAVSIPFIAQRGAQVAGAGSLFVPVISVGEKSLDLSSLTLQAAAQPTAGALKLQADLKDLSPGLKLTRTFTLAEDESVLRISDQLVNEGQAAVQVGLAMRSKQEGQGWNLVTRHLAGNAGRMQNLTTPVESDQTQESPAGAGAAWRMVSQYGVGMLYRVDGPGKLTSRLQATKGSGGPVEWTWTSAPVELAAGKSLEVPATVLIDQGGKTPYLVHSTSLANPVVAALIMPNAGSKGAELEVQVIVTAGKAQKVSVELKADYTWLNWKSERDALPAKSIGKVELQLTPGQAQTCTFKLAHPEAGCHRINAVVRDEQGKTLAGAGDRAFVDPGNQPGETTQSFERWSRKLPEAHFKGTWEEIGKQLVEKKLIKAGKGGPNATKALAFYQKKFPYYARILQGAAEALNVKLEQMVDATISADASVATACMGLWVDGPDGPIHLYSKERSGGGVGGMGYAKVVPDQGYRFHMYTLGAPTFGYGVNSQGLATSGATINCDTATDQAGMQYTAARAKEGKFEAPLGVWMMMAMCKDVEEAVKFIGDPEAPLNFTGNMLITDRQGNAAVLESVGTFQQIRRDDRSKPVFATGNYSHPRADGKFAIGSNWGWAANTMLREHFVGQFLQKRQGKASLADAFAIMGSHDEPGGMCQHVTDNVGELYSTCSCIIVARTGEMFISHGPPCTVKYVRYPLND